MKGVVTDETLFSYIFLYIYISQNGPKMAKNDRKMPKNGQIDPKFGQNMHFGGFHQFPKFCKILRIFALFLGEKPHFLPFFWKKMNNQTLDEKPI